MLTKEQKVVQNSALTVAEYQNKDKPEIKVIKDKIEVVSNRMQELQKSLRDYQQTRQVLTLELRAALMPLIAADLRD